MPHFFSFLYVPYLCGEISILGPKYESTPTQKILLCFVFPETQQFSTKSINSM